MRSLDVGAYAWLGNKPPEQWSKSNSDTHPQCDLTMNNNSESFNKMIMRARFKPNTHHALLDKRVFDAESARAKGLCS